jgi:hypothetical protein
MEIERSRMHTIIWPEPPVKWGARWAAVTSAGRIASIVEPKIWAENLGDDIVAV